MRKKSTYPLFLAWAMLLGMLFQVLVGYQNSGHDLLLIRQSDGQVVLENMLHHAQNHTHFPLEREDHDDSSHSHEDQKFSIPAFYPGTLKGPDQDFFALRLLTLPTLQPDWSTLTEITQSYTKTPPPGRSPPSAQIRLALTTTILLI